MSNTILIADDNQMLRNCLTHILEEAGYSVVQASNGREALTHIHSSTEFGLLITDLVMPDMEGLELITILKTSHPSLTIMGISGAFDEEFLESAKRLGVKDTLQKPVTRASLLKTVESALTKRASSAAQ